MDIGHVGTLSSLFHVCDGFVDNIGVDKLKENGLLTDDLKASDSGDIELSEEDAAKAADAVIDCADFEQLFSEGLGEDMPAEVKDCINEAINDDVLKEFLTGIFSGSTAGQEELQNQMMECATAGQG